MSIPSRSSSSENWNEYKRLVLAELERLNDCVEKLRDQHTNIITGHDKDIAEKLAEVIAKTNARIKDIDLSLKKEITVTIRREIGIISDRIKKLEKDSKDNNIKEHKNTSLAFWTTVLTVVCALITSIVSMIISIWF